MKALQNLKNEASLTFLISGMEGYSEMKNTVYYISFRDITNYFHNKLKKLIIFSTYHLVIVESGNFHHKKSNVLFFVQLTVLIE